MVYEVEYKVELTKEEKGKLIEKFKDLGYEFRKVTPQRDFWVKIEESKYKDQGGAYNIDRYRHEDAQYIHTVKKWDIAGGHLTRSEEETKISKEEFDKVIKENPNVPSLEKVREWYWGNLNGEKISITIDTVKFDHSDEERYFLEAEIDVKDKNLVKETKNKIINYLKFLLEKENIEEAEGMVAMVLEKK